MLQCTAVDDSGVHLTPRKPECQQALPRGCGKLVFDNLNQFLFGAGHAQAEPLSNLLMQGRHILHMP